MGRTGLEGAGTANREDVSGPGPVQSVDRAVAILEILARDGEAGVTEVARELGVHKSTASRLLAALDRRELVVQDAARGRFRLGVGLVRLAGAASRRRPPASPWPRPFAPRIPPTSSVPSNPLVPSIRAHCCP